jgi:hypothetical protein
MNTNTSKRNTPPIHQKTLGFFFGGVKGAVVDMADLQNFPPLTLPDNSIANALKLFERHLGKSLFERPNNVIATLLEESETFADALVGHLAAGTFDLIAGAFVHNSYYSVRVREMAEFVGGRSVVADGANGKHFAL